MSLGSHQWIHSDSIVSSAKSVIIVGSLIKDKPWTLSNVRNSGLLYRRVMVSYMTGSMSVSETEDSIKAVATTS
jgi:hypothetical protein